MKGYNNPLAKLIINQELLSKIKFLKRIFQNKNIGSVRRETNYIMIKLWIWIDSINQKVSGKSSLCGWGLFVLHFTPKLHFTAWRSYVFFQTQKIHAKCIVSSLRIYFLHTYTWTLQAYQHTERRKVNKLCVIQQIKILNVNT